MKDAAKVKQGKKNKAAGQRFELKVRKDLEEKGWIVSKWMNNVEFWIDQSNGEETSGTRLIPAKHKFCGIGRPMAIGTGFPDFVCWHKNLNVEVLKQLRGEKHHCVGTLGVEAKSNGYLDKIEKEKCEWLIENNVFSKILVASKDPNKRGAILYKEFK